MRFLSLLVALPVFAQCQGLSDSRAYRRDACVLLTFNLGSNAGYTTDELWLPAEGVRCILMRDRESEDEATPAVGRLFLLAEFCPPPAEFDTGVEIRVPSSVVARLVELARLRQELDRLQVAAADEALAASVVRDLSEVERMMLENAAPPCADPSGDR